MDETFRMLGKEHEADLERDAEKWRHAADARRHKPVSELGSEGKSAESQGRGVSRVPGSLRFLCVRSVCRPLAGHQE